MHTPGMGRGDHVPRRGSQSVRPAPAQRPAEPLCLEPNSPARRSLGARGRGRARGGVCARPSAGVSWAVSGCRAPGRGWPRAAGAGSTRGPAHSGARPRPLRCATGRERCARAAATAALQVNGRWARGAGGTRSGRRPLGGAQAEGAPWGRSRGRPSRGAPPQGHRTSAGRVPGVAGPSPPPAPGSGAPRSPRGLGCRVTTRKRGSGAKPVACFLRPARGSGSDSGALARFSSPPGVGREEGARRPSAP